jgi:hypothetical protein
MKLHGDGLFAADGNRHITPVLGTESVEHMGT